MKDIQIYFKYDLMLNIITSYLIIPHWTKIKQTNFHKNTANHKQQTQQGQEFGDTMSH